MSKKNNHNIESILTEAVAKPLNFPALNESVFPGDQIAVVADEFVCQTPELLALFLTKLVQFGVEPKNVKLVLPEDKAREIANSLSEFLPKSWRSEIDICPFCANHPQHVEILGLTADGEPIAVFRPIVEADVVLPVERFHLAPTPGYFGIHGAVFPRFADLPTQIRFQAADMSEKRAYAVESLEMELEKTAALLGILFTTQILTDQNGVIEEIVCGDPKAVRKELKEKRFSRTKKHSEK